MSGFSVIGDIHGKYEKYHKIIRKEEHFYTIQLGDFGFKYETLKNVDSNCHKIIGGNHDNYDICWNYPHFLKDYGNITHNGIEFFYYRGAYSIDRQYRTVGIDWWSNEENNIEAFQAARELYREKKPKIVITHDCPEFLVPEYIGRYSRIYQNITNWALGELFNIHQPKLWIHGHHHKSKTTKYGETTFVCLDELETYKIS
jgi:predicted phosphodiesterase